MMRALVGNAWRLIVTMKEKIIVYTKDGCHACEEVKRQLEERKWSYESRNIEDFPEEFKVARKWAMEHKQLQMPIVKQGDNFILTEELKLFMEEK